MPKSEDAWHRNLRRSRQSAKGVLAAKKLGLDIPEATIEAAKRVLLEHHATDADTMLSWSASAQQKMQNRIWHKMQEMENMMSGNNFAMQNQTGQMPGGNGGKTGWKGNGKGNQGGTRVSKEVAREAKMGARGVKY